MTEAAFVRANLPRWREFEQGLEKPRQIDPDHLRTLYVQLTDDLAFAQTHFPQSESTQYLHTLAGKVHKLVYRNKRQDLRQLVQFWATEVPLIAHRHRRQLRNALLVFLLSTLIGALSAAHDPTFVQLILGDSYVNMTEANIAKDDPMAVYKKAGRGDMFLAISLNNIRVSFIAFAFGLFTAVGSGLVLFYNGVMLGAFQYFFYQKGLFITSFLSIWIHGTLEISVIIIAGAAGMILGNGWLFPGTLPRLESFRQAARDGVKLVIGLVPIFIVAGFLEGFVTRLTHWNAFFKLFIILTSAGFILFYFYFLPRQLKDYAKLRNH